MIIDFKKASLLFLAWQKSEPLLYCQWINQYTYCHQCTLVLMPLAYIPYDISYEQNQAHRSCIESTREQHYAPNIEY